MKKLNRNERYEQASTEIRTALLLASDMLSKMEVARNSYASRQKVAARDSYETGVDVLKAITEAQRLLRPIAFFKTAKERAQAERLKRRRERD